eukprot:1159275-Pelagomonas_calceolata.AAC.7
MKGWIHGGCACCQGAVVPDVRMQLLSPIGAHRKEVFLRTCVHAIHGKEKKKCKALMCAHAAAQPHSSAS